MQPSENSNINDPQKPQAVNNANNVHPSLAVLDNRVPEMKKHAHRFIFGYILLILIFIAIGSVYSWQHKKVTNLNKQVATLSSQVNSLEKQASNKQTSKSSSNSTTSTLNTYSGWKTYTLKYEKLSFKFPSTWKIVSTSNLNNADSVQFSSPDGFNFSIADGVAAPGGGTLKIISSEPVNLAGQQTYIDYIAAEPQYDPSQTKVATAVVVSNPTNELSRPVDKNVLSTSGSAGDFFNITMNYNAALNKYLTAQSVQTDPEYKNAILVIQSMAY